MTMSSTRSPIMFCTSPPLAAHLSPRACYSQITQLAGASSPALSETSSTEGANHTPSLAFFRTQGWPSYYYSLSKT